MHSLIFWNTLIFIANSVFGLILLLKPDQAIDIQKRFYFMINWRMEPVNMALELRNTRIMGLMVMGAVIVCIVYMTIHTGGKFRI